MAYLCFASQQALLKIRGDAVRINNKPVGAYVWATGGSLRMQHAHCVSMLALQEELRGLNKLVKRCHVNG